MSEQDTAAAPLATPARRAISFRSVALGLAGVCLICGLTPYNDYALNNTFMIGNNFPLGVVMLLFLFIVFINGPLNRWRPAWAFTGGEVAVAFSMTLVSCALPSSGLMRYFPPSLVSPFYHAQARTDFLQFMDALRVPRWLFPSFHGRGPREWMSDPIVTGYIGRWTEEGPIPYLAWLTPAATWGVFIFALFIALICILTLVRRQWFENERLAFPLAEIYLSLLDEPQRGRMFNAHLGRRSFWIAFGCVFALHLWNGTSRYFPKYLPEIWVYYSLPQLFTEAPWKYVDTKIVDAAVFFTVAGVTYFLPTSIAFSLWLFYILEQLYRMGLGTFTGDPANHGIGDQQFGGLIAYGIAIFWIGRKHWKLILAQAIRGARADEPRGRYLPYSIAFWTLVGCTLVMIGWLVLAGAGIGASIVTVILLLFLFMMSARFVAEAGLVHSGRLVNLQKPWQFLLRSGWIHPISNESYYLATMLNATHYDFREIVPVYASHGMKVADHSVFADKGMGRDAAADRATGRKFIGVLLLALFVGYGVAFMSTLWTEYHFAWTQDMQAKVPINDWGAWFNPLWGVVDTCVAYERGQFNQPHNSAPHFTFGLAFTGLLSFLRLRYTWWPLHPIGYLMLGTFPAAHLWFSIFVGWLAKVIVVRFGGSRSYTNAKPFFLGLIVGESMAAAFWMVMGILLSSMGLPYRPVNIMPG